MLPPLQDANEKVHGQPQAVCDVEEAPAHSLLLVAPGCGADTRLRRKLSALASALDRILIDRFQAKVVSLGPTGQSGGVSAEKSRLRVGH